ncbi:ornithine cyclodeaminase family protein [Wohlfahrtiimonas larvae]|uniref:Ornithine cyclodeaminase family protein n=1 Tax=Wohlfahrtiimonas larvae TaxID=1157986 RepID=A0ABP9MKA9_9GAMM|nr:ornithine cyclodeaminase [Wohlfahrtiimonas larvae]
MKLLNESLIQSIYSMKDAIADVKAVLEAKIANQIENPLRTVIEFPKEHASVLYMPSADLNTNIMTMKAVTIFPNNPAKGKKTTQGVVLVSDATNGDHLALLNASYLTRLRTGALSGLATDQLAKKNARVLTVIGTGAMAFEQVLGVLAVRDIQTINLFNPSKDSAVVFKEKLRDFGVPESIAIHITEDRVQAVKDADIINCATRSKDPVFNGDDLQPGTHVNGVGSYLPDMREVDFTFIQRADKIIVDDFHGATEEAGELIHANQQDDWSYDEIKGELAALVVNHIQGRENDDEITFFKCVGAAYFDLAVAQGVYQKAVRENVGVDFEI